MLKKTINFGYIDYDENNRNDNLVTVEIVLKNTEKPCLSICGNIWNSSRSNILSGGQNLDTIKPYLEGNKLFEIVHDMWEKYHLNEMRIGTMEQMKAIQEWKLQGNEWDYEKAIEHLKEIGLYESMYEGKMCKFGYHWFYEPIPQKDLATIVAILV